MTVAALASSWASRAVSPSRWESELGRYVCGVEEEVAARAPAARWLAAIDPALRKALFISLDVSAVTVFKLATPLSAAATISAGTVSSYDGPSKMSRMSYLPDVR